MRSLHAIIGCVLMWVVATTCTPGALAQGATEPYFPLPDIPESITDLNERANYLVEHYWDRISWKSAFSSRQGMQQSLKSYLDVLPLASQEAVHRSLDGFLKNVKKNPAGLAYVTRLAEGYLYSDSALYSSDEVLLKFLDAASTAKKLDKDSRARYGKLKSRIEGSMQGKRVWPVAITLPDGSTTDLGKKIDASTAEAIIIYIDDPERADASMTRLRLDADSRLSRLAEEGVIDVVALYPHAPTDLWRETATRYPASWTAAASEEADTRLDMRAMPTFYVLDKEGNVAHKNLDLDQLLYLIYSLN